MAANGHKVILLTGATDGLGLETAKALVSLEHKLLIHGRSAEKLAQVTDELHSIQRGELVESYQADLTDLAQVAQMAKVIAQKHQNLDILINNAGVFNTAQTIVPGLGLDSRFVVNSIAPYLLTQMLLPLMTKSGRVVNLSSAAQAPVDLEALQGKVQLSDNAAYAQSKLAITMWSRYLAAQTCEPSVIALNPKSFLASKMVQKAYGVAGTDISVGVNILLRAALADEFADANGLYYDNDIGAFSEPHTDALDMHKCQQVTHIIAALVQPYL